MLLHATRGRHNNLFLFSYFRCLYRSAGSIKWSTLDCFNYVISMLKQSFCALDFTQVTNNSWRLRCLRISSHRNTQKTNIIYSACICGAESLRWPKIVTNQLTLPPPFRRFVLPKVDRSQRCDDALMIKWTWLVPSLIFHVTSLILYVTSIYSWQFSANVTTWRSLIGCDEAKGGDGCIYSRPHRSSFIYSTRVSWKE